MREVVAVIAALGIVLLIVLGGESDTAGRDREGFEEGPAQALVAAPASDPVPVITVVEEQGRDRLPEGTAAQLSEVRDLLVAAAEQPSEQARPALDEALGKLDSSIAQIETAARETDNRVTKLRLLRLQHVLQAVQEAVVTRAAGL